MGTPTVSVIIANYNRAHLLEQAIQSLKDEETTAGSDLPDDFEEAWSLAGGEAAAILKRHGVVRDSLLKVLMEIRGSQRITDPNPEDKYQALDKFSRDLTELARMGKLDPVIGRDDEIRRIVQVLSRRTKNNPVLIGEPGVGKSAIAEGLALRIIQKKVSRILFNKRIVETIRKIRNGRIAVGCDASVPGMATPRTCTVA